MCGTFCGGLFPDPGREDYKPAGLTLSLRYLASEVNSCHSDDANILCFNAKNYHVNTIQQTQGEGDQLESGPSNQIKCESTLKGLSI